MSKAFNFQSFLSTFANTLLPAIGQAVEALHPGDNVEAAKITVGTALIAATVNAIQSSYTATPEAPQSSATTAAVAAPASATSGITPGAQS